MNAIIRVNMDNAAFDVEDLGRIELARVLRVLADKLEEDREAVPIPIRDYNGNRIGSLEIEEEG